MGCGNGCHQLYARNLQQRKSHRYGSIFRLNASGQILRAAQQNLSCNIEELDAATQYFYSLTSYDASNFALTISVGDFTTATTQGVEDISAVPLSVYPNPAKEILNIDLEHAANNAALVLFDMSGRIVETHNCTSLRETIDISRLAAGTYILRLVENGVASAGVQVVKK